MKKNILKAVIAVVFIVGAIISFNVEAKAYVPEPTASSCTSSIACEEIAMATLNEPSQTYTCCDYLNTNLRGCKEN